MRLQLIDAAGIIPTVSLSALETGTQGWQAQPGALGFGAPERQAGWSEKLGSGATRTQRRYSRRQVDIQLYCYTSSAASLDTFYSQLLAMSSADTVILRATEEDATPVTSWDLICENMSGAGFSYGVDTDGRTIIKTMISLEAGNPFWRATTETVLTYTIPAGATAVNVNSVTLAGQVAPQVRWEWAINGSGSLTRVSATTSMGKSYSYGPAYNNLPAGTTTVSHGETSAQGIVAGAWQDLNAYAEITPGFWATVPVYRTGTFLLSANRTTNSSTTVSVYLRYHQLRLGVV